MPAPDLTSPVAARLQSIDALRGLVILFMLLDHVRETFLLHMQVPDPMDVAVTEPALFFSRTLAHLCAPVFIFLTGLSAFLYGEKHQDRHAVSSFLLKRGLFLVALEFTLVNFAWTFQFPPQVIYLHVIWALGLTILALSALLWPPRPGLVPPGLPVIGRHNLLDPLHFPVGSPVHLPWAILHDRGWLEVSDSLRVRTSYPLLPWIGVIALGYAAGPWFGRNADAERRQHNLANWGRAALVGEDGLRTLMSLLNITKYPPSLLFLCLTLGTGLLLLRHFERRQDRAWLRPLTVFGAAPMFFYLLHLYVLKLLYLAAVAIWDLNRGSHFGFEAVWPLWLWTVVLAVALYPAVRWFAELKARRRDIAWLKYL